MKNQCSHYSRQLTKEEVIQIINLQNANISSADIASIKNLKGSHVCMIKHCNKLHAALPPWTIIKKRVTDGRTGLLIKKYICENPKHSANDIHCLLMGELGPGIPIPSKPTVNRFLDMNGYVIRAMKSETLICPVNV